MLDYKHKLYKNMGSINAELLELKTKFTKMEFDITISRNVNIMLVESLVVTGRKCWANEQYSRRECLEISGVPEPVGDNALEDKIQGALRGIDAEFDTGNIESCHCLKGNGNKGNMMLKLSMRTQKNKIRPEKTE